MKACFDQFRSVTNVIINPVAKKKTNLPKISKSDGIRLIVLCAEFTESGLIEGCTSVVFDS